jgi:hypothetical protein
MSEIIRDQVSLMVPKVPKVLEEREFQHLRLVKNAKKSRKNW